MSDPTYYDTVLANMDIGANLCCVDHTVLLDEDMISDVQREEGHPGWRDVGWEEKNMKFACLFNGHATNKN